MMRRTTFLALLLAAAAANAQQANPAAVTPANAPAQAAHILRKMAEAAAQVDSTDAVSTGAQAALADA
jgi:hypothetical protein